MGFEIEKIEFNQPSILVAEHQLLVQWITQNPHRGVLEYTSERVIDRESKVAVYYIHGIGMGNGKAFAMVQHNQIILFDAWSGAYSTESRTQAIDVVAVTIPEEFDSQRPYYQQLMNEALIAYNIAYPFAFWSHTAVEINFEKINWTVTPQKYSALYWKTKIKKWWNKSWAFRRGSKNFLLSPVSCLISFLICAGLFGAAIPLWIIFLLAGWFFLRLTQYKEDHHYWLWFFGNTKLKNVTLSMTEFTLSVLEPKSLNRITVTVHLDQSEQEEYTLEIKNTSWYFVQYLSIDSWALADLLATGYRKKVEQGKPANEYNALIKVAFSPLEKRWMLPKQSISVKRPIHPGYHVDFTNTQIVALVQVSKRVSGEPMRVANAYNLPVIFRAH